MPAPAVSLPPGFRLDFHEKLDSTNSEALRRAAGGGTGGLWVWALGQDAGRGRLGRHWESLAGNLFASLLLRPECPPATASQLGFVAGLALHDTVAALRGPARAPVLQIKWPNDLLCAGKKAGGILLESTTDQSGRLAVVMGIGLNLAAHPQETGYGATSLAQHAVVAEPAGAFERLAQSCAKWLGVWNTGAGFANIRREWTGRALPPGTELEVRSPGGSLQGTFGGIDEDGGLILIQNSGAERRVTAGDVFPL